ncbi:MAG: hypothetical protein EA382_13625 [Spirochaetaceae bacterium]|nr:MAG: hypothetical protein EA382_13625 [Spirochaetaceae bacterium]
MKVVAALLVLVAAYGVFVTTDGSADDRGSISSAVEIDAIVGTGGLVVPGTWVPVLVTARATASDVRGTITVLVERAGRTAERAASRVVELPAGTTKSFRFAIPLVSTAEPVTVAVERDGRTLASTRVSVAGRGAADSVIVALSRQPALDALLAAASSARSPSVRTPAVRPIPVAYPLLDTLPDVWYAYDGVTAVVIHDARIRSLETSQIEALRDWVAAGGRAIVSIGVESSPADLRALEPILAPLRRTAQASAPPAVRPVVATVADAGLEALGVGVPATEAGGPLVIVDVAGFGPRAARFALGLGSVTILPFDAINLARVAPVTSVDTWRVLLASGSTVSAPSVTRRRLLETELIANQLGELGGAFAPRWLVATGLLLYAAVWVAGLSLIGAHRGASRRVIGATIVIAATVTAVALISALVRLQPDTHAVSVELAVADSAKRFAIVERDTAVFSRSASEYSVAYQGRPLVPTVGTAAPAVTDDEARRTVTLPLRRWGSDLSYALDVVPLNVIATISAAASSGRTVRVINESGMLLRDAVVVADGELHRLGDIAAGEQLERPIGSGERVDSIRDWTRFVAGSIDAAHRARLLGDIARAPGFHTRSDGPIAIAWPQTPLLPVDLDSRFDDAVSIHVIVIRLSDPETQR